MCVESCLLNSESMRGDLWMADPYWMWRYCWLMRSPLGSLCTNVYQFSDLDGTADSTVAGAKSSSRGALILCTFLSWPRILGQSRYLDHDCKVSFCFDSEGFILFGVDLDGALLLCLWEWPLLSCENPDEGSPTLLFPASVSDLVLGGAPFYKSGRCTKGSPWLRSNWGFLPKLLLKLEFSCLHGPAGKGLTDTAPSESSGHHWLKSIRTGDNFWSLVSWA